MTALDFKNELLKDLGIILGPDGTEEIEMALSRAVEMLYWRSLGFWGTAPKNECNKYNDLYKASVLYEKLHETNASMSNNDFAALLNELLLQVSHNNVSAAVLDHTKALVNVVFYGCGSIELRISGYYELFVESMSDMLIPMTEASYENCTKFNRESHPYKRITKRLIDMYTRHRYSKPAPAEFTYHIEDDHKIIEEMAETLECIQKKVVDLNLKCVAAQHKIRSGAANSIGTDKRPTALVWPLVCFASFNEERDTRLAGVVFTARRNSY